MSTESSVLKLLDMEIAMLQPGCYLQYTKELLLSEFPDLAAVAKWANERGLLFHAGPEFCSIGKRPTAPSKT